MNNRIEKRIELKAPFGAGVAGHQRLARVRRLVQGQHRVRFVAGQPAEVSITHPGYEHVRGK